MYLFCEAEPETLYHILYQCPYSRRFWNDFKSYWCRLSNQQVRLSLQNVIFGIISQQCPSTKLLNYFIVVGKLFLWDCRKNQIKPKIKGYQNKVANKYVTKRKIKKNDYFEKKHGHLALALRWLEIVFIFPRLVLQILFQIQFGLSYQSEIYHSNK